MRLWSYHSPDFSLVEGVYDPEKSKFYKEYHKHYHKLWDYVCCKELVWYATSQDDWEQKDGEKEWELEVPETAFLKIVDCIVWAGILGYKEPPLAGRLQDQLLQEAIENIPDPDDAYKSVQTEVQKMMHPSGDPWESLFLSDANDLRTCFEIKILGNFIKPRPVVTPAEAVFS